MTSARTVVGMRAVVEHLREREREGLSPNDKPVVKTFVPAGTYEEYRRYCVEREIVPRRDEYRYVSSTRDLRGQRGCALVLTGRYVETRVAEMSDVRRLEDVGYFSEVRREPVLKP